MRASLAASTYQAIFFAPTVANKRLVARAVLVSVECSSVPTSVLLAMDGKQSVGWRRVDHDDHGDTDDER